MKKEFTVWFACRRVRSGEIDGHAMAVAYLAAAAAATGKPITGKKMSKGGSIDKKGGARRRFQRTATGRLRKPTSPVRPPAFPPIPIPRVEEHFGEHFGECDYDDSYDTLNWGNAEHGLEARDLTTLVHWRVQGVPPECDVSGRSSLKFDRLSEATLTVEGPEEWIGPIVQAFARALEPFDILRDEEGATQLAVESALTDRVLYDIGFPWTAEALDKADQSLAGSDPNGPAGMALCFFVAVGSLVLGRLDRADALLTELETPKRKIRFSHGINVFYQEGKPVTVGWQDDFPCQAPEVRLARAALRALRGEKARAEALLRRFPKAAEEVTRTQAAEMLAWLQA